MKPLSSASHMLTPVPLKGGVHNCFLISQGLFLIALVYDWLDTENCNSRALFIFYCSLLKMLACMFECLFETLQTTHVTILVTKAMEERFFYGQASTI